MTQEKQNNQELDEDDASLIEQFNSSYIPEWDDKPSETPWQSKTADNTPQVGPDAILAKSAKVLSGLEPFVSGASKALIPDFLSDPAVSEEEKKALEGFNIQKKDRPYFDKERIRDDWYAGQQAMKSSNEDFNKAAPELGLGLDIGLPFFMPGGAALKGAGVAKTMGVGAGAGLVAGAGYSDAELLGKDKDFSEEAAKLAGDAVLPTALGAAIPGAGYTAAKGTELVTRGVRLGDLVDIFKEASKGKKIFGDKAQKQRVVEAESIGKEIVESVSSLNKQSGDAIKQSLDSIKDTKIPSKDVLGKMESELSSLRSSATSQDEVLTIDNIQELLDRFKVKKERIEIMEALGDYNKKVTAKKAQADFVGESISAAKPKVDIENRLVTGGVRKQANDLAESFESIQIPIKSSQIKKIAEEATIKDLDILKDTLDSMYKPGVAKIVTQQKEMVMDALEKELKKVNPEVYKDFIIHRRRLQNQMKLINDSPYSIGQAHDTRTKDFQSAFSKKVSELDGPEEINVAYEEAIRKLGKELRESTGTIDKAKSFENMLSQFDKVTQGGSQQLVSRAKDVSNLENLSKFGESQMASGNHPFTRLIGGFSNIMGRSAELLGRGSSKIPPMRSAALPAIMENLYSQYPDEPEQNMTMMKALNTPELDSEDKELLDLYNKSSTAQEVDGFKLSPNEELKYTKEGSPAIFDTNTKQFIRYADE